MLFVSFQPLVIYLSLYSDVLHPRGWGLFQSCPVTFLWHLGRWKAKKKMLSDRLTNSWLQLTRAASGYVNYHRTLSIRSEPDLVVQTREEQSKVQIWGWECSSAGRVLAWGARGPGFNSQNHWM